MQEDREFKIGDWVVHHYHGVGKIEDIVKKGIGGNEKTYYKVVTPKMKYWIPLKDETSNNIEPIRTKTEFEEMIKLLSQTPEAIAKHHKSRKKRIHARWLEGSLSSRAKLLRDLNGRYRTKKLSFNEKEMMKKIKRYLINEWVIADDTMTRAKAKKTIKKALKQSVQKIRETTEE